MRLQLEAAGRFDDSVLFTRAAGDVDPLRRLAAATTAAARRARLAVEDRPYRPHLTLARGRPGVDLRPAADDLGSFRSTPWTLAELHLVQSLPGAGADGSVYRTAARWPLGGRPAPAPDPQP
jgi:2'-5' RNA ligase